MEHYLELSEIAACIATRQGGVGTELPDKANAVQG
jgi:hypothetical protein